ncbi:hypothetical protein PNOK_0838200 [Pyrrhoderma noxium]|uniref:Uncharacterized protein n=1 Tax=Pyrrhoderma noxium TaxID=2282107 RepID=A0A286UAZ8_9AGAM|nr:hypothetical protein PNOK_0838200 [Pyrrhoderma noxium]
MSRPRSRANSIGSYPPRIPTPTSTSSDQTICANRKNSTCSSSSTGGSSPVKTQTWKGDSLDGRKSRLGLYVYDHSFPTERTRTISVSSVWAPKPLALVSLAWGEAKKIREILKQHPDASRGRKQILIGLQIALERTDKSLRKLSGSGDEDLTMDEVRNILTASRISTPLQGKCLFCLNEALASLEEPDFFIDKARQELLSLSMMRT